jgi:dTDP-glucose 4,6-dehydratase
MQQSKTVLDQDAEFILSKLDHFLPLLSGRRIFLTGATGFFGKHILHAIQSINSVIDEPIKLVALARNPNAFITRFPLFDDKNIEFLQGDILEPVSIVNDFDYIINTAVASTQELACNDPKEIYQVAYMGTKNIIDFAQTNPQAKILYTSSGTVYEPTLFSNAAIDETASLASIEVPDSKNDFCVLAKLNAEAMHHQSNLNYVIARCFSFVGPYLPLDANFAIGNFINDVLRGSDIVIKSDGSAMRSYLYTADLVTWLLTLLVKANSGEVYNLGAAKAYTIKEVAETVLKISGSKSRLIIQGVPDGSPRSRYYPCVDKAKRDLGLEAWYDLEMAVRRTMEWNKLGL